mmetsp:Transcript_129297/g.289096  ORF Transcript_129297/g.289096 Transcript_129297/m.289096 type:complete len:333 (+) Transcript_129297:88-1086(+)
MGGGYSTIVLKPDQPSSEPDKLAVVSDPFPESVTIEDLWDGMMEWIKYPVPEMHRTVLKSCEVTQNDGFNDFNVKITLDGKKLDQWGYGKGDGTDRITTNNRCKVDKSKWEIYTINYKSTCWAGEEVGDDKVYITAITRIHKPTVPIQYEFYLDYPLENPPRHATDKEAADVTGAIIDPIVTRLANTKYRVVPEAPSLSGAGKVVLTPELPDVTYDNFWKSLIAIFKAGAQMMGGTPIDTSDKQFKTDTKDDIGNHTISTTDFDMESGLIEAVTMTNGVMIQKWVYAIQKDPVRMEVYMMNGADGERRADKRISNMVQIQLNNTLAKCNSWW